MNVYLIPTIPAIASVGHIQQKTGLRAVIAGNVVRLIDPLAIKRTHTPKKASHPQPSFGPYGGGAA